MIWIESVSNSQPHFLLNILEVQVLWFTYTKLQESSESYTEVTWSDGGVGVRAILGQNCLNQVRISTKKSEVSLISYCTTTVTHQLSYQFILQVIGWADHQYINTMAVATWFYGFASFEPFFLNKKEPLYLCFHPLISNCIIKLDCYTPLLQN